MTCRGYWSTNKELRHLTANANAPEPEGWSVIGTLQAFLALVDVQLIAGTPLIHGAKSCAHIQSHGYARHVQLTPMVIDYGCGAGRLSNAFPPVGYLGLDINPAAVDAARLANPGYRYRVIEGFDLPPTDLLLAYTTLLHLDDAETEQFFNGAAAAPVKRLLICEICGKQYRRLGAPPHAYNRDLDEYATLAEARGYESEATLLRPYLRYRGLQLVPGETRTPEIAMMLFKQKEPSND